MAGGTKVTTHGEERIHGRMGIPLRSAKRAADNARVRGKKRTDFSGSLRRYLDLLYHKGVETQAATDIRVYSNSVFLFAGDYLVTMWPLPPKYRNKKAVTGHRQGKKSPARVG